MGEASASSIPPSTTVPSTPDRKDEMPRHTKKKGQGPRTRGRHKHRASKETKVWNEMHKQQKVVTKP